MSKTIKLTDSQRQAVSQILTAYKLNPKGYGHIGWINGHTIKALKKVGILKEKSYGYSCEFADSFIDTLSNNGVDVSSVNENIKRINKKNAYKRLENASKERDEAYETYNEARLRHQEIMDLALRDYKEKYDAAEEKVKKISSITSALDKVREKIEASARVDADKIPQEIFLDIKKESDRATLISAVKESMKRLKDSGAEWRDISKTTKLSLD